MLFKPDPVTCGLFYGYLYNIDMYQFNNVKKSLESRESLSTMKVTIVTLFFFVILFLDEYKMNKYHDFRHPL